MFRLLIFFVFSTITASAQSTLQFIVKDSVTKEPLIGATAVVEGTTNGASSDAQGLLTIKNVANGSIKVTFSLLGYNKRTLALELQASPPKPQIIFLTQSQQQMEEVIVSTTRTNSRIEDLPVKMEVIGADDLDEESTIEPETIGSILGDIAGVQVQQTSAFSTNSNLRIQGLSGRYTQILRDGLPLFEGFSGGFSVLDIPPLDLKQIEIVKGSASTLYGGGAIAGLVNLISKEPSDSTKNTVSLNQTSFKETNFSFFHSGKKKKVSSTLYAGGTYQQAVDVDKDGFSDQPQMRSALLHPRIFIAPDAQTQIKIGYSGALENTAGGDMKAVEGNSDSLHVYVQKNKTLRNSLDVDFSRKVNDKNVFSVKGVASHYLRELLEPQFRFKGMQFSSYAEASYLLSAKNDDIVIGANMKSDVFRKTYSENPAIADYNYLTTGLFIQNAWQATGKLTIESGLREDYQNEYGWFFLPRLSFLYKFSQSWTARLNGGLGYKVPDVFSSDIEDIDLRDIAGLSKDIKPEKSYGANFDVNYHHLFGEMSMTINQSFFYTRVNSPVAAIEDSSGKFLFDNYGNYTESKGTETYIRLAIEPFDIYLGYTFTIPQTVIGANRYDVLLNARDKFAVAATYDIENSWKVGIESSYTGEQYVAVNDKRPGYWFVATMIQKTLKKVSITLNCENLLDFRQSRKEDVVLPPYANPGFRPIWASLEGRVVNLAARFSF